MKKTQETYLFEQASIPKAVMSLAIPTIISSLVMVIYNLADTYFVGMLNDPVQNAAVTLAAPVLLAFNAVNNLFGVGSSSMMSRALGRKDYVTLSQSSAFGFYCALISGLLLSLLYTVFSPFFLRLLGASGENVSATAEYLKWTTSFGAVPAILNVVMAYMVRSEGASMHASIGTMSGCLLNIILDPFFILPNWLGMGAAGAGLATCISNAVACGYFFVLLWFRRKKTCVCISPKMSLAGKSVVFGVFAVGIPASIQNLLNVTGMTILNNFASAFGSDAVAAIGIAQKINTIPVYIALGLGQGIMPLISYTYASKNITRMKDSLTFSLKASLLFIVPVTLLYYFAAPALIEMFMKNNSIVAYGTAFLRGMCLSLPFMCIDFLAVGTFQATGMGTTSLVFAVLRKIVLEIPALVVLNFFFPLYGLAYAQSLAEFVLSIAAVIVLIAMIRRLYKEKSETQ